MIGLIEAELERLGVSVDDPVESFGGVRVFQGNSSPYRDPCAIGCVHIDFPAESYTGPAIAFLAALKEIETGPVASMNFDSAIEAIQRVARLSQEVQS